MLTIDGLADRALHQARLLGREVLAPRNVVRIDPATRDACIDGEASLHARTVILATGSTWREPAIGEKEPGPLSLCLPNVSRSPRS